MPFPFLLSAQHRLVMRCAHHDAIFVGELGIQRIVLVEGVVSHRRPEIVGLQPQQKFKHFRVELMIVVPAFFSHPSREPRRPVVPKNSPPPTPPSPPPTPLILYH